MNKDTKHEATDEGMAMATYNRDNRLGLEMGECALFVSPKSLVCGGHLSSDIPREGLGGS